MRTRPFRRGGRLFLLTCLLYAHMVVSLAAVVWTRWSPLHHSRLHDYYPQGSTKRIMMMMMGPDDGDDDDDDVTAGDEDAHHVATSNGNCGKAKNAILGATLGVNRQHHHGTYSWSSNLKRRRARNPSSVFSTDNKDNVYQRIPFDGCGTILIQEQLEAGFYEPNSSNKKKKKNRTGLTLWSASYAMAYFLDAHWAQEGSGRPVAHGVGTNNDDDDAEESSSSSTRRSSTSRWTVLELGAGVGLCSAVAVKHGMNVVATDNDPAVLSLLRKNLQQDQRMPHDSSSSKPQQQQVHALSLDWVTAANDLAAEQSHPVFVQVESLGGADLILLSDVIYRATQPAWNALLVLLQKFRSQRRRLRLRRDDDETFDSNSKDTKRIMILSEYDDDSPRVLLGYTQRRRDMSPDDEARFFAMIKAAGMEAVLMPSTRIPNAEKYMLTCLFELRWVDLLTNGSSQCAQRPVNTRQPFPQQQQQT